ncbi:MAG: hypothetical protein NVSMB64_17290 [Candidatus Velthaea sp.]
MFMVFGSPHRTYERLDNDEVGQQALGHLVRGDGYVELFADGGSRLAMTKTQVLAGERLHL